jgi:hypothetical protein
VEDFAAARPGKQRFYKLKYMTILEEFLMSEADAGFPGELLEPSHPQAFSGNLRIEAACRTWDRDCMGSLL